MKRSFIFAAAALVALDYAFTRRWERIIRERAVHLDKAASELELAWEVYRDSVSQLEEREQISSAVFAALADARSAIIATVENMGADEGEEA